MSDRAITFSAAILIFLVVGFLLYSRYAEVPKAPPRPAAADTKTERKVLTNVKVGRITCDMVSGLSRMQAAIHNTGNLTLSMVTVKTEWRNRTGLVTDSREIYVVSPEQPLAPGERRMFEDSSKSSTAVSCHVIPIDWGT